MSYLQAVGSYRGNGTPNYAEDVRITDKLLEACPVLRDIFKGDRHMIKHDNPKLRTAMSEIDKYIDRRRKQTFVDGKTNDTDVTEPALRLRRTLHYAMQMKINLEACY